MARERKEGRERQGWRERSSSDPFFSLTIQRHADVGRGKRTAKKLKWTPAGISSAKDEEDGISMIERHTAFMIINFVLTIGPGLKLN